MNCNKSISRSNFDFVNPLSALCFKDFEKMRAISLYWVAAQEQTGTFRQQKFGLFYLKFSVVFNELSLNF